MAGLLSKAAAAPEDASAADAPTAAPPPDTGDMSTDDASEGDTGDEQPNVSPEEQAQYDQFVKNGMSILYGDDSKVRPDVLSRLKEASDPIENLANTATWLTVNLENSAESGGKQLDDGVVLHGGIAMLEELAEISEAAGIHEFSQDELQGATYRAMDLYRETMTQSGKIDPGELKSQFDQIVAADKEGDVGKVLPQLGAQQEQPATPPPVADNAMGAPNG